ncbi:MAG: ABC transporter substrate-binding protein, partial [Rubrivivax sp.]|nr:ABC transporter substrate-binding protein [Rubrivivax sp.]
MNWRTTLALAAAATALLAVPAAQAQKGKDTLVLGMQLEPTPGLDPTAGAASAIAEVSLYNIFETLTKVGSDSKITGLLAESWTVSPDLKVYTFKLRQGVKFHNGEAFDSGTVKFAFERAVAKESVNKDKAVFANIEKIDTPDKHTVVLNLKNPSIDLPFQLGQGTAIIVEPKSAATNGTQPVGTGPYRLEAWNKGSSVVLTRWDGHRNAKDVKLRRATFRFISDPAAAAAALLAGDVDAFPRVATRVVPQFQANKKFQVVVSGTRAKTIMAINNKRKPLDDVRVRRAIYAAIDRKAVIDGAAEGFGVPIGSFYVPGAPGYVDTTGINPFDQAKARALLHQAGITPPLELTMKLPPVSYARQGGEVIAAQLAKVGINVKIENVEWAQWMSGVYGQKAYDLTIVSHVEPLDFGNFARPNYYWNYESKAFNELWGRINATVKPEERNKLMADAQKMVAEEAVAIYLYQPTGLTVAN